MGRSWPLSPVTVDWVAVVTVDWVAVVTVDWVAEQRARA